MLEKILTEIAKKANPGRDVSVEKIGKRFFMHSHDTTGCRDYLLEGTYTYDEVKKLNDLTADSGKYHCGFGFCKELGPIAFIGVANSHFCTTSGYFKHNVHEYGTSEDDSEYYFNLYSDEDAKKISNYTVYGFQGLEKVATKAPISKMLYIYDSRYKCKKDFGQNEDKEILEMDLKLSGIYTFDEARLLATGTRADMDAFSGEAHPIQFAQVGDKYFGIINLWMHKNDLWFRDVWEYGCEEPKLEKMRYLSKEEAKEINRFSLYVYICPYSLKTKTYPVEKMDRSFDKRFNFHLSDGRDYRLI